MSLNAINNHGLDKHIKTLASREREVLKEMLLHIAEADRRRLYLDLGYPSLFAYLTKSVGYSDGSAQRRIDAARLSSEIPNIIDKLESGDLNLAQVSLMQKSIRTAQDLTNTKVDSETKEQLAEQMSNKSFSDSEILLSKALNITPKMATRIAHQKDESVRLEITFTKIQWQKLVQMRDLVSSSLPNGSAWDQVLEYASDKMIQQKDRSLAAKGKSENSTSFNGRNLKAIETAARDKNIDHQSEFNLPKPTPPRNPISMSTQRKVFRRDQCCQYQDKVTKKICGSKWRLSIDHIQPIWAGGSNELENLRLLCSAHNRHRYRRQARLSFHKIT